MKNNHKTRTKKKYRSLWDAVTDGRILRTEDDGTTVCLEVDQVLLQDATGTLVHQALDFLGPASPVRLEAVQYVDHNLMQADFRNADDHRYLRDSCAARRINYSPPGNGISHPVHMETRGRPATILVGSDSHTCAAGALGALSIGLGSLSVASILQGEPLRLKKPRQISVHLIGSLQIGVSAKDIILEILRRLGTSGGSGAALEYYGSGLAGLSVWDRHVIANMGAETGALTSLFPSDSVTKAYLESVGRGKDWKAVEAVEAASPDIEIDLSTLGPLVARPSDPSDVVPVEDVLGTPIHQAYLGSSANPGVLDFAAAADVLDEARVAEGVSLEINPTTRSVLKSIIASGVLTRLIETGGRLHQTGCNGCNGMGQAPGTGMNSIRTVPRNFPGRSGSKEDAIFLASPETVAASARAGVIADPRIWAKKRAQAELQSAAQNPAVHFPPLSHLEENARFHGPNIARLPDLPVFDPIFDGPFIATLGDDISTDAISPAGAAALPYRSNIEKLADFTFCNLIDNYVEKARMTVESGHAIVAGINYGQGSSREHAALCPRILGLGVVVAQSFARIHRQNLISSGIVPLTTSTKDKNWERIRFDFRELQDNGNLEVYVFEKGNWQLMSMNCELSAYEKAVLTSGGLLNYLKMSKVKSGI